MSEPAAADFFAACRGGDVAAMEAMLARDPALVRARTEDGSTALHVAAAHRDAVRSLLTHGADPNARDAGDNATPLHFAAGGGDVEIVRALLDAGADVHAEGDLHRLEAIGWAACFGPRPHAEVVALLLERGARHHVFSAIAVRDLDALREVVARDPAALARRLSQYEGGQTALHYVLAPPDGQGGGGPRTGEHLAVLDLLLALGADVHAMDDRGRTPMTLALRRSDLAAMRRLAAAGAQLPEMPPTIDAPDAPTLRASVPGTEVMLRVDDVRSTVAWYEAIGFERAGSHEDGGVLTWAAVSFGGALVMFVPGGAPAERREASLWFRTGDVDAVHASLARLQRERAASLLAGHSSPLPEIRFAQDLHDAFYGQREFTIIDPNGWELSFAQEIVR